MPCPTIPSELILDLAHTLRYANKLVRRTRGLVAILDGEHHALVECLNDWGVAVLFSAPVPPFLQQGA